jgi:hypothetical protein
MITGLLAAVALLLGSALLVLPLWQEQRRDEQRGLTSSRVYVAWLLYGIAVSLMISFVQTQALGKHLTVEVIAISAVVTGLLMVGYGYGWKRRARRQRELRTASEAGIRPVPDRSAALLRHYRYFMLLNAIIPLVLVPAMGFFLGAITPLMIGAAILMSASGTLGTYLSWRLGEYQWRARGWEW